MTDREELDARLAKHLAEALVKEIRAEDARCPECQGPANHPPQSSACKRVKAQRGDSDDHQ